MHHQQGLGETRCLIDGCHHGPQGLAHRVAAQGRADVGHVAAVALEHAVQAQLAANFDAALEGLGIVGQAHECRVAGHAAHTQDADALGVGMTLFDGPLGGVGQIVLGAFGELAQASLEMLPAKAGAAAVFRAQDGIAARGEELRRRIPLPFVTADERAAVHQHDHGQLALEAGGLVEPGRYRQAIARLDVHEVLFAHEARVDGRARRADRGELLGGHVVDQGAGGLAV